MKFKNNLMCCPKVTHLSALAQGGAALAALRLHRALRDLGVASEFLTKARTDNSAAVRSANPHRGRHRKILGKLRKTVIEWEHQPYRLTKSSQLEVFTDDRSATPWLLDGEVTGDIVNLHWVANLPSQDGFLDYDRFFNVQLAGRPLVWTLHDMNPMTGGCHYSLGCTRFEDKCGVCPLLGSAQDHDISRKIQERKRNALSRLDPALVQIVAPSRWLAHQARNSALLKRFNVTHMPYGIDLETFRPINRGAARAALGIPIDRKVVAFIADDLANHRKGIDLLYQGMRVYTDLKPILLTVGGGRTQERSACDMIEFGRIENEKFMAAALAAADVFVIPSRADNLPNVVLEAMAVGIPTVGFAVGGVTDMVLHGETGLLCAPENASELGQAVRQLLEDAEFAAYLGKRAREIAEERFSAGKQAKAYMDLYAGLLETYKSCNAGSKLSRS